MKKHRSIAKIYKKDKKIKEYKQKNSVYVSNKKECCYGITIGELTAGNKLSNFHNLIVNEFKILPKEIK